MTPPASATCAPFSRSPRTSTGARPSLTTATTSTEARWPRGPLSRPAGRRHRMCAAFAARLLSAAGKPPGGDGLQGAAGPRRRPVLHGSFCETLWPVRFWARCVDPSMGIDALRRSAALTCLSDILVARPHRAGVRLAVGRPRSCTDRLRPRLLHRTISDHTGHLIASRAQETLTSSSYMNYCPFTVLGPTISVLPKPWAGSWNGAVQ